MFREVSRKKGALPERECKEILKNEKRGVLSILGDDGYPYGMPMNHFYCEEDGRIYFHSGRKGHKIDAIGQYEKASFCVYEQGFRKEGDWSLNIRSVIVFGKIKLADDPVKTESIARQLCLKFTDDKEYIDSEIERDLDATVLIEMTVEHMTGKMVNES